MKVVTPGGSPYAPVIPQHVESKDVDSDSRDKTVESPKNDKPTIVR